MKKILGSWKLWTVLSAFIFVMTFSLVVYAATNLTTSSPYTAWKTSSTDKILDEDEWNTLMEKLQNQANNAIPAWAIMAFTGPTCPSWWTRYAEADGRFLMGASNNFWYKTWANEIRLRREQLPNHSHPYIDAFYSESVSVYKNRVSNHSPDEADTYSQETRALESIWSNNSDNDNYPIYWIRTTEGNICGGNGLAAGFYKNQEIPENACSKFYENPDSVNITNKYITVLFCKKN